MRRVLVPGLLAIAMVAMSSANASAFGLFDRLCGDSCDSCCAAPEPVCGCEVVEPVCGCEPVDPCCDPCAAPAQKGLLDRLFHRDHGCDSCCAAPEPVCGCEVVEPVCGCEAVEPVCGCESHHGKIRPFGGFFHNLLHHRDACGCDSCGAPEPVCGIEPACGCEIAPACGCGM